MEELSAVKATTVGATKQSQAYAIWLRVQKGTAEYTSTEYTSPHDVNKLSVK